MRGMGLFVTILGAIFVLASQRSPAAPEAYVLREYPVPAGSHPHDVAPAADGGVWYTAQTAGALPPLDPVTGNTSHVDLRERSAPHGAIVGPPEPARLTDGHPQCVLRVDALSRSVQR